MALFFNLAVVYLIINNFPTNTKRCNLMKYSILLTIYPIIDKGSSIIKQHMIRKHCQSPNNKRVLCLVYFDDQHTGFILNFILYYLFFSFLGFKMFKKIKYLK